MATPAPNLSTVPLAGGISADALIGTRTPPAGGYGPAAEAYQSLAYYEGDPYPRYAFGPQQWPAARGPVPTPLPYARVLIEEGAEFVFRGDAQGPRFDVPDCEAADALLDAVLQQNGMGARWPSLAARCGHYGTIAVKFSVDQDDPECPVRLAFLACPEECRVWLDPHDQNRVLMARIQYPYRDAVTGDWFYFREEWTADRWVRYRPRPAGDLGRNGGLGTAGVASYLALPGYTSTFGDGEGWERESGGDDANPFGVLPVRLIRNRRREGLPLGVGDLWGMFRLMDRIALAMHGEDKASQMHSSPVTAAINATLDNTGPLQPDETLSLVSASPDGAPADLKMLEPSGQAREWTHKTIDRWERLLYDAVGLSYVDPAAITNKGNMTRLALQMAYSRTIATSDRKRALWGDSGMCLLLRDLLTGLRNMGGPLAAALPDAAPTVTCSWPDYFPATDDDLSAITDRTIRQSDAGLLTPPLAARRVAVAEKMPPEQVEEVVAAAEERMTRDARLEEERTAAEVRRLRAAPLPGQGGGGAGSGDEAAAAYEDASDASGGGAFSA